MLATNLPRRFAKAGIVIGFIVMALYWYGYKSNLDSAQGVFEVVRKVMFILCPGLLLQIFTIGTGDVLGLVLWVIAVFLNIPIYYCIGLVLVALLKGQSNVPER
jgi:hypothetical protein